ncbi:MAG: hypothetical protein CVT88_07580, partial [Candidatus Altiarchaeales archaeon HGW-Altiarchaeales-1]
MEMQQNMATDLEIIKQLGKQLNIELKQLKEIDFRKFQYEKGYILDENKNIIGLCLNDTNISDISVLGNLKNLTQLDLWNNNISDISVLGNLKNLTQLNLRYNNISDISVLG